MRENTENSLLLESRKEAHKIQTIENLPLNNKISYRLYLLSNLSLGLLYLLNLLPYYFTDLKEINLFSLTFILPSADFRVYIIAVLGVSVIFLALKALLTSSQQLSIELHWKNAYIPLTIFNIVIFVALLIVIEFLDVFLMYFILWLVGSLIIIRWQEEAFIENFLLEKSLEKSLEK